MKNKKNYKKKIKFDRFIFISVAVNFCPELFAKKFNSGQK